MVPADAGPSWQLWGGSNAVLKLRLGDKITGILKLRWRQVAHHSALRDDSMLRNSILLSRQDYVPWRWKLHLLTRLAQLAGFVFVIAPDRRQRLVLIATGTVRGVKVRARPHA